MFKSQIIQLKCSTYLNREVSIEETEMAEKYLKKCSVPLANREVQIKITLGFHLIHVTMADINNIHGSNADKDVEQMKHFSMFSGSANLFRL